LPAEADEVVGGLIPGVGRLRDTDRFRKSEPDGDPHAFAYSLARYDCRADEKSAKRGLFPVDASLVRDIIEGWTGTGALRLQGSHAVRATDRTRVWYVAADWMLPGWEVTTTWPLESIGVRYRD
jgi:hypothetical protein